MSDSNTVLRAGLTARWWITNGENYKLITISGLDDNERPIQLSINDREWDELVRLRSVAPDNPYLGR